MVMNIGIVGAGKIVKEALPVMSEIPEIKIKSIVTTGRNPGNVAQLKERFEIKSVFEDYQAFLKDESIDTIYLAIEVVLKQSMLESGNCKLAQFNYSQFSSRYDDCKKGMIQPAFDSKQGGGALMDINVYNIHLALALFGEPSKVAYYANVENN